MRSVPPRGSGWVSHQHLWTLDRPATEAVLILRNPTHGSGWIVQIQPTNLGFEDLRIPPTEVGGWFRSYLLVYSKAHEMKSFLNALCRAASEAGSEPSTNFRWWDSRSRFVIACRRDLNHPPTSVGGIQEYSHSLYRAVVLTSLDRALMTASDIWTIIPSSESK